MKVSENRQPATVNFGAALTKEGEKQLVKTRKAILKLLDADGDTIIIQPRANLPSAKESDTGIGKMTSKTAQSYIKFLKTYTGMNVLEDLPIGQINRSEFGAKSNKYFPYSRNSMDYELDVIDWKLLVDDGLLKNEDHKNLVDTHNKISKLITTPHQTGDNELSDIDINSKVVHFENELGKEENGEIPALNLLKKAFNNLKEGKSEKINALKTEFNKYKNDNAELLQNTHTGPIKDPELFKFSQFIAHKHVLQGKQALNQEGIRLCNDLHINNNNLKKAYPDAFHGSVGWGMDALNPAKYRNDGSLNGPITNENMGPASKLLQAKTKFLGKVSDMLRVDVGRFYAQPYTKGNNESTINGHTQNYDILMHIEDTFKKEKEGRKEKFSLRDIIHEVVTGPGDGFSIYAPHDKKHFEGRRVLFPTSHGSNDYNTFWHVEGNGFRRGEDYLIGTGCHDDNSLRDIAEKPHLEGTKGKANAYLSSNLKLDPAKTWQHSKDFVSAKFAELYMAKDRFMIFTDVLGRNGKFDCHNQNAYRARVGEDFEKEYHTALQDGRGLNDMESLAIVMKAKGLDTQESKLYNEAVTLGKKLREKGPLTREEAETAINAKNPNTEKNTTKSVETEKAQDKKEKKQTNLKNIIIGALGLGAVGTAIGIYSSKNKNQNDSQRTYLKDYELPRDEQLKPYYTPKPKVQSRTFNGFQ